MKLRALVARAAAVGLFGVIVMVAACSQRYEDTVVVGLSADITTFEPGMISGQDNTNIARHIFGRLFDLDPEGEHLPELAHTVEISDDGTVYVYTLREGLTCHDGEPLTAEDVAYTFNRIADPENRFTGNAPGFVFTSIGFQGAEALDDVRVQINLARQNPIAFGLITEVHIHCKDSYERMTLDEAASNPIGSGSYRLASWTRGSEVVLEKVGEPGNFQRIVWRIIPEASTRTAELIAGNVDIITNVVPEQIEAINGSGRAEVQVVSGTRRMYLGFNLSEASRRMPGGEAIQDAGVRRALQYAVDVPTICRQLLGVECERATGPVNPPNGNPNLSPYPYDPPTAERLLDEAGWARGSDGMRFAIRLQAGQGRYVNDVNIILAISQYLQDVGLDIEVDLMEWASVYTPLLRVVIALLLAIPLGVLAAIHRGTAWDGSITTFSMLGQSIPNFWMGIMMILFFGLYLRLLPISGHVPFLAPMMAGDFGTALSNLPRTIHHLILPGIAVGTYSLARNTRLIRSSLLEVLEQDYVRTARSKGLPEMRVLIHHALRNAWLPVVTIIGLEFGFLLGGVVVVETVFSYPGIGRLLFAAINQRDIPLVQAGVVLLAGIFILLNLVVDLVYVRLDPRMKLAEGR